MNAARCACTARAPRAPGRRDHPDLPADLAPFGQPVLVPGSMGTASYVLAGVAGSDAFHSTCHGAGRVLSRHAATRRIRGQALRDQLEAAGVMVRGASMRGLAEEAPFAYKDVDEVVRTCEQAGLARRVARLRPDRRGQGVAMRTASRAPTLPHPADLMLQAWAPTPEGCIAEAVRALVESFADTLRATPLHHARFRGRRYAWDERLVSALEEVLFLLDTRERNPDRGVGHAGRSRHRRHLLPASRTQRCRPGR